MRKADKGTTKVAITFVVIGVIASLLWYLFKNKGKGGGGFMGAGLFGGGDSDNDATLVMQGTAIVGTTSSNPGVFVVSFGTGTQRPPDGEKYRALVNKVRISGTGKWDGVYNTRPGWFFIDSNGRLGNLVIESAIPGNFTGPVRVEVIN